MRGILLAALIIRKGRFDMKKNPALPALAIFGGAASFLLRLLQNRTGFEPDTGLPIPGNLPGLALVVLLMLLAAAICVLVGKLPKEQDPGPAFPADFSTTEPKLLMLPVMVVFVLLGMRCARLLPEKLVKRCVTVALIISGLALVIKNVI